MPPSKLRVSHGAGRAAASKHASKFVAREAQRGEPGESDEEEDDDEEDDDGKPFAKPPADDEDDDEDDDAESSDPKKAAADAKKRRNEAFSVTKGVVDARQSIDAAPEG